MTSQIASNQVSNLAQPGFIIARGDRPSLKPEQICVLQLFLVRQQIFDRFDKCLFNHVAEARLAFDHGFSEFFRLLESDVRRQRWNFRIGDCFQNYWTRRAERLFPCWRNLFRFVDANAGEAQHFSVPRELERRHGLRAFVFWIAG